MHHALTIVELCSLICSYLPEQALAALARTCKSFHNPAVRALWEEQSTLYHLIECLPQDAWTVTEDTGDQGRVLRLTRTLRPDDWHTFLKYARLIKAVWNHSWCNLRCRCDSHPRLDANVLVSIISASPVPNILPHLRSIEWGVVQAPPEQLPTLASLFGQSLRYCWIDLSEFKLVKERAGILVSSFLSILPVKSPEIERFFLVTAISSPVPFDASTRLAMSDALIGLKNLTELCSRVMLTSDGVRALSALPKLRSCNVRLPDIVDWGSFNVGTPLFPALEALIIAAPLHVYEAFARAVDRLPLLSDLAILTIGPPHPEAIHNLFGTIRRVHVPTKLVKLVVQPYDQSQPFVDGRTALENNVVIRSEHFRPMLDFTCISEFVFDSPMVYALDDILLFLMAAAWPSLQSLTLGAAPYCYPPSTTMLPGATLRGLAGFAMRCPRLTTLRLHLDTSLGDESASAVLHHVGLWRRSRDRDARPVLGTLFLGQSSLRAQPEDVALLLSFYFPELSSVKYLNVTGRQDVVLRDTQGWEVVNGFLSAFRRVRRDEQRWARQEPQAESDEDSDSEEEDAAEDGDGDGGEIAGEV